MTDPTQQELEWGEDWAPDEEPLDLDLDNISGEVVA